MWGIILCTVSVCAVSSVSVEEQIVIVSGVNCHYWTSFIVCSNSFITQYKDFNDYNYEHG